MSLYKDAMNVAAELTPYAELEDTELGETLTHLISLSNCTALKSEFYPHLIKEMQAQLNHFKQNTRIIRHKEIQEIEYDILEWKGVDY